ncbi:MAG: DUF2723 domain-containing protein [Ignavibacteriales bacterium]|nr:DUF2723 domain-containing protein [Ignavibacteriales bacterium]
MIFLKKYYTVVSTLSIFIIYLITLAPTVIQIDAGELAAVEAKLGIAHPTGYPLFTVLGYLFVNLPLPFSEIFLANLLAAIYCSIGTSIFAASSKLVLDNLQLFSKKQIILKSKKTKSVKEIEQITVDPELETKIILSVILGSIVLGLSKTFWFQSTSVEVYSLHILLINLIIYFLLRAFIEKDDDKKSWLLFALMLGLGFSNHMTTMLILPATAYLYFLKNQFNKNAYKKIGLMLAIFFPILILLYSYLPIRATQNPEINWGNPFDLERILRHISGKQYQVWLFTSIDAAKKQFTYFISNLPLEFATISLVFCIIGIFTSFIKAKKFFVFVIITFISTVLYSINYDINDIDSYFLLAYISFSFFAVFGIYKLIDILTLKKESILIPVSGILVCILLQFYINFPKVNQNNIYIIEDYSKSLINSTEKNSIIFSYQWDFFVSASYYFQHVDNFRKDVTIIDKELLRRSWYFNQMKRNSPQIAERIQPEINQFLSAVKPFEREENYDPNLLENAYQRVMAKLISENINVHPFYIGPELFDNEMQNGQFALPQGYFLVPDLFLFKVVRTTEYVPSKEPNFKIRIPEQKNYYYNFIENTVGSMLVRRAMYEMKFDKIDKARVYINKVKKDFPNYIIPEELQNVFK